MLLIATCCTAEDDLELLADDRDFRLMAPHIGLALHGSADRTERALAQVPLAQVLQERLDRQRPARRLLDQLAQIAACAPWPCTFSRSQASSGAKSPRPMASSRPGICALAARNSWAASSAPSV